MAESITRFQQLGAFVNNIDRVGDDKLHAFASIGGKWIVPLLAQLGYPDDHDPSCVKNLEELDSFKSRCDVLKIAVGGWFNGWAGGELGTTAAEDAAKIAQLAKSKNLGPMVLDLEAAYKYNPQELPMLCYELRQLVKTRGIAVSTNEPNDAMLWNGGATGVKASMRKLDIRVMPQWYNAPAYGQGTWMQPDQTMEFMFKHGMEDNFYDSAAKNKRAVPLSFVHGTLEVTGLEGADLAGELAALERAKAFGYSVGLSVYTLETMPDSDYNLLAIHRNKLYLG